MAAAARDLTNAIRAAIQARWPGTVRTWPQPNWPLTLEDGRKVRPPNRGISDIAGIGPGGRYIAIEVKAGTDRLSGSQGSFLSMVRMMGGIGIVGRSVEQVIKELEEGLDDISPREGKS
jgi:hypothetical protein